MQTMDIFMLLLLLGFVFFAAYGFLAYGFMRWLSRLYIASIADPASFKLTSRALGWVGIVCVAILPPCAELLARIVLDVNTYDAWIFILFVVAWLISFVPAILVSRRALRAAGIDPDSEWRQ
jgi:hypothetical protein